MGETSSVLAAALAFVAVACGASVADVDAVNDVNDDQPIHDPEHPAHGDAGPGDTATQQANRQQTDRIGEFADPNADGGGKTPAGATNAIPTGPVPGYPCSELNEQVSVPRVVHCGCTVTGVFDCISGYLATYSAPCPGGVQAGDEVCSAPPEGVESGCLMSDPRGGEMTCICDGALWKCF